MILLTASAIAADEPSKTTNGTTSGNPGWDFKLTPNSGPLLSEPVNPEKAPLFGVPFNSKVQRKGQGEPTFTLPHVWWTGDYLTPLEKSRRVIPRSDRVRE